MSGRTKEELDRIKSQQQNAKAKKKKTATNKKTGGNEALGLRLPSVFDEKKTFNTLKKEDQKTTLQNMRTRMEAAERKEAAEKKETRKTTATRYNPLIKTQTRLTKDTSPEIDNLAEATLRKGMQGMEGALVGYSDSRNMKRAEDILTGEYNDRFVPGVRTGLRMKVDDPAQVAKAEAEAKKAGFNSVEDWEVAKANELIRANDDFYRRKEALDADVDAQGYTGIKKYIPEVAEVIGSMVPTLAVGAASGGIGAAAGLSGRAAWAFGQLMTGGEISNRVSGQEARQVYDALKQQSGNAMSREQMVDAIKKANTAGELVGLAEAGTEALFGGLPFIGKGIADEAAKKIGWELLSPTTKASIQAWRNTTTGRIMTQVAQRMGGALGEGLEESIMTLAQPAIENAVAGLETEVTMQDILRDFGMGVAVSLVLGVPVTTAETASAAVDAVSSRNARNEVMLAFENRFKDLVSAGQLTPEEAKTKVQEVKDILGGRGSLNVNDVQPETKVANDAKEVYGDVTEAHEALTKKAEGKEVGEEVSVAVVENGVAETWKATVTENGIEKMQLDTTTEEEAQAYINKAQKMGSATNEAERTGYQLNVKDEIVQEVSALSKALGKEIEFVSTGGAVHGYVDEAGKISVNINSSESPARAVIAHEMTHLLEGTSSYAKLMDLVTENYGSSLEAKHAEIKANYEAAGHPLKDTEVDYELMAHFVEEKLLTDKATVQKLLQKDRTIGQKILDWINKVIQKITGTKEQRFLIEARDLWNRALQENKKASYVEDAGIRYSAGKSFSEQVEKIHNMTYDPQVEGEYIVVSEHLPDIVLDKIPHVDDSKLIMYYKKLYYSMESRPQSSNLYYDEEKDKNVNFHNMGQKVIKMIPDLMNKPEYILGFPNGRINIVSLLPENIYDGNKEDLFVSVDFDVERVVENKFGKHHMIVTAFPSSGNYLNRQIAKATSIIYDKNKEAVSNPGTRRRDSTGSLITSASKNIITDSEEKGKQTFSIGRSEDAAYLDAVNRGDMETAQRMVDDAAKAAGYDSPKLYHGTDYFGFTKVRTEGLEDVYDWSPFFATNDPDVAETYSGETERRRIKDRPTWDFENITINDLVAYAKDVVDGSARVATPEDIEKLRAPLIDEVEKWGSQLDAEYVGRKVNPDKQALMAEAKANLWKMVNAKTKKEAEDAWYAFYDNSMNILYGRNDASFEDNLYFNFPPLRLKEVERLFDDEVIVIDSGRFTHQLGADELRKKMKTMSGRGIYSLYANTDGLHVIDAEGKYWNDIPGRFIGKDGFTDTRGVALYARDRGYSGVIIRNLIDVGGETEYKAPSDIYIFFEPHFQVKSADPVTYDDDGNVIPLSERFKDENDDIRWSIGKEDVADKDLRDLIKSENRKMREVFFSRSAMDRDLLWEMIEDEERNIVATGSYRYKMVQDIIDFAYETGFRYINEEMEPENSLGKVSIYVPERYRGEMDTLGGIAEVNKQMFGSGILFTYKENKNALDDAYATLQAENKGLLPETTDPSEQVQSILDVFGRGARNSLRELDADEYNPFAERDNPYRTDIENAVHDAMDSITALAVKKLAEQSRNAGREDVNRWVAKKIREDARNYTVGSVVDIDGERGTVTERITKGRSISYTVELDTGERRENVKPEELNVGVTPTLRYDELPKNEQKAWHEPPEDWDISRDLGDVAPLPISMKEFREILYENGITVGLRKLNEWFKNHGYLRKVERIYLPTQKSLDEGLFEGEKYGALITEEGQRYFLDLFTHNADDFADPEDTNNLVLPGNKQDKDSPLEERDYKEMIAEYEDEIGTTGEDYAWAQALTGKGVTYSKDYARNFDAAAKNNPNLRKHLQRLFARPLESAKADYANAVRSKLGEMHSKMKELGIKKDTKESQAVQWYGEGQYQDKFGGMHEYTIEMLKEEFPTKWKDIEAAATYFRHVYDDYLNEINAARELIYPHPLEDAQDQIASYEVRRDRAEDKIVELRGTISELETVLAAKKAEYANAAEEDNAALQKAIRYNEDRLNKAKISLGDYIARRSKYGEKIRQIQADIDSGDILRNKRILPRKDYFHHFQEMTNSLGDVFRLSRNSTEIDPRLEGTSGYTEPRSKFSGITLHRNNGRYKADAIGGFIEYAQAGEYMIHIDPVISQFRSHIAGMANATKDSRNANKLIRWLVQWTNDLAGKTNPADRFVQDVIGREAVQFARKINSRAKANAVVGNLNSATAQIFNLPNLVAHVKDPKAYVEGFADLCRFVAREKSTRDIVKESGFLSERYLDDVIKSFDEKKIKIPEKVAAWTLTVGDRYSTALIWFTAHHEAVNKGMRNPIEYADDVARRCVAGRGIGEIPITQKSNITQIFAPFQIEVNNAWQLYKEKIAGVKNAETKRGKMTSFAQFLAILIVNFMLNTVTDLLIHRRVAFDPIYVLFQCISDWMNEDEDEEKNWAEKFMELMGRESGEIISNMPYGSLVAYYAFNNQWARQNLFGDQDPTRFGVGNTSLEWVVGLVNSLSTGEDVVDDALGFLTTFVMPFGGKQAERTLQGLVNTGVLPQVKWGWKEGLTLGRVEAPGSYTKDGEFQFPLHTVKTDFGQWVANVLFGKYATDEGQKYLGKDFENSTFLQNVFGFNKTKERKELSEKATKVLTDLVKNGADVFEVYDTIRGLQDAEDTYAKNNVLRNSALTQDEKAKIILGYMTQNDDVESTEAKINAVLGVGLTIDDYLDIRNMYTIINKDENLNSASDKAYQFVSELAAAGYSSDQIAGIYEGMSFWQSIPANIDKFTEMTSAGLDSQTALKVQEAFSALEPLPGKTTVSALQKVEAIAKLELGAEQEILAMSQAMGKEQYAKYKATTSYGVDAQTWVDFQNALAAADAANSEESKRNGSYDKDEKKAALDSMDVSNDVKAALWQTLDTSIGREDKDTAWKAGRNPYSTKVGADIVDQYMEAKKEWTVKAPEASEDVSLDSMAAPLAGGGRITSGFGYRNTGIAGASTNHQAIDIAAPVGTDVGATIAGVVTRVSSSGGYGNSVEITSTDAEGNKIVTKYSHLDNFGVAVGDTVAQGQKIGEVGNTGTSSGAHLDFKLGVNDQWVDPSQYLDLSAAGIVDGTNYAIQEGTGGSAAVMANSYSGGGSSGGGSSSRSGGGYTSAGSRVATVSSGRSNSAGSSGSGSTGGNGVLSLPKVDRSASVAGRSVTSPTYGAKGLTLPKAGSRTPVSGQTSVATTQRTGRTGGSLWDPDILG